MDPQAPYIRGLIRDLKQKKKNNVRTAVNWTTTPYYTLLYHVTNSWENLTENQSKKGI